MTHLGKQIIVELYDCPAPLLSDVDFIEKTMQAAALAMKATIVQSNFHHFSPLGVSGVVVIMESHLTIHTWPEYGYAAIDVFTCGAIDTMAGIRYLEETLKANSIETQVLNRGYSKKFISL